MALSSVDYLMREITYGWSFRYLHSYATVWFTDGRYRYLKKGKGRCSDQKDYKDRNHGYLKFNIGYLLDHLSR